MEKASPHLQHLVMCSKSPDVTSDLGDITYSVIMEALLVHKNPPHRFMIYPVFPRWKLTIPSDILSKKPDIGLINFREEGRPFEYRLGIESNSFMDGVMAGLPDPGVVASNLEVQRVLWAAYLRAEDKAKTAVREEHFPPQRPFDYLLFVGPYWTHVTLGPFDQENLAIPTDKESPTSGDRVADWREKMRLKQEPVYRNLWLVGTLESQRKMEEIISSTDD